MRHSPTVLRILLPVFLFGILTSQALHFVPTENRQIRVWLAGFQLLLDETLYFSWGWCI